MAETNPIERFIDRAAGVVRQAYDRVSGRSEGGITPAIVGDWHNNLPGTVEARVMTGQSKVGFHHAVEVRAAGTQAAPAKWSEAVSTQREAWNAGAAASARMLDMPAQDNSPKASAVRDAAFAQSLPEAASQTQGRASPATLVKDSEAYHLVKELWTNLSGNLGYTEDKLGPAAVRDEKESVLNSIDRIFGNPQAAAYLAAKGKDPMQMTAAVESGNLAAARQGITNPSLSALPSQNQRNAARQAAPAPQASAVQSQAARQQLVQPSARPSL